MTESTPLWILAIAAGLFLLWQFWRGWSLGVVRAVCGWVGLLTGGVLGWFAARLSMRLPEAWFPWEPWVTAGVTGVAVGFAIYFAVTLLSALVFKRTSHQSSWMIRWAFGLGGGIIGLIGGVFLLLLAYFLLLGGGPVATQKTSSAQPVTPPSQNPAPAPAPTGSTRSVHEVYTNILLLQRVLRDPEAMNRFANQDPVLELSTHPTIVELSMDPAIQEAVSEGNYLRLTTHPGVLRALTDRDLVQKLLAIDLTQVLEASSRPE
jgi:hypothetical protein